jgi:hypothetical protein
VLGDTDIAVKEKTINKKVNHHVAWWRNIHWPAVKHTKGKKGCGMGNYIFT